TNGRHHRAESLRKKISAMMRTQRSMRTRLKPLCPNVRNARCKTRSRKRTARPLRARSSRLLGCSASSSAIGASMSATSTRTL
ncbi:hypothetical protein LTR53_020511, partial [Teratosphaeriaceae sp. CCFEE 6253]